MINEELHQAINTLKHQAITQNDGNIDGQCRVSVNELYSVIHFVEGVFGVKQLDKWSITEDEDSASI